MQKIVTALFLIFMGTLALTQFVHATDQLIIIRSYGNIDPPTASISSMDATYTFTEEIHAEIIVQKSNIIIDGKNFTLKGDRALNSTGILLFNVENVTIKNVYITGFFYAIKIEDSKNCIVTGNTIMDSDFGVWIENATGIVVIKNVFSGLWCGTVLKNSSKNQISGNSFSNNMHGLMLDWSPENILAKNNLTDNSSGISLAWSGNNFISENVIMGKTKKNEYGIKLYSSSDNVILNNHVENTFYAMSLLYNTVRNLIIRNRISRNFYGIKIWYATNNSIYHNIFIDNAEQAKCYSFPNKWDNGYPEGGNYWSNYVGTDIKSGKNQDRPGSDGIGDVPHFIDDKNVDHYPLIGNPLKHEFNQAPALFYLLAIITPTILGTALFMLYRVKMTKTKPEKVYGSPEERFAKRKV
ncbi:MAG: NosD domain-containing protein [Candidatus Bathyarchaeia archaeon]